jgi:pimeloyl-ACP methyl ester carboxylesterase
MIFDLLYALKPEKNMPETLQFTLTHYPSTIEAVSYGDPDKPIILMLHGWLDNAASFALLAPMLSDYHVIAVDFPGHGLSQLPKDLDQFSLRIYVETVEAVVTQLTDQPIILIGHSMGGAVASVYASENPNKVSKLVFIDSLGPPSSDGLVQNPTATTNAKTMQQAAIYASSKTYPSLESMVAIRMKANHLTKEQATELTQRGVEKKEEGFKWRYHPRVAEASAFYYTEDDVLNLLAKITCPVLIIAGTEGIFQGRDFYQKRLAMIINHHLAYIDGHHHIHLEEAKLVYEKINQFIID